MVRILLRRREPAGHRLQGVRGHQQSKAAVWGGGSGGTDRLSCGDAKDVTHLQPGHPAMGCLFGILCAEPPMGCAWG